MPSPLHTTIRDLHRARGRERRGQTLAEGVRLVEEALAAQAGIEAVVHSRTLEKTARGQALLAALAASAVPLERVEDQELEKLAETEHPQGIIAVVETPRWTLAQIAATTGPVLVLDGVQDPGNTGTILRTAQGLGASAVIALPGTVELANPKVVRGSMGAIFRLPALSLTVTEFQNWARDHGVSILRAELGGAPIGTITAEPPVAVILGNEGAGLRAELRTVGRPVTIPLAAGTESLNVAVAAAILLYEVTRDR